MPYLTATRETGLATLDTPKDVRTSRLPDPREAGAGRRSEAAVDYVSALVPPLVMAVAFTLLVVTIIKNQGGANRAKEDAAVDAVLARTEAEVPAGSVSAAVPNQSVSSARAGS